MNYVFIRPNTAYPLLYRHDVYGANSPSFGQAIDWMSPYSTGVSSCTVIRRKGHNSFIGVF